MAKTIIVSNRLPIKIQKSEKGLTYSPSEGGLATGLGSIYKEGNNIWLGWPGIHLNGDNEKKKVTEDLGKENMSPVFLTPTEIEEYYEGFCNATLWPNFHYFNQYIIYDSNLWEYYKKVNKKFSERIIEISEPGDTIWVHDYQLLLVPRLIREKLPEMSIGFFLHIPFPSYESFRLLPWRREILLGMLGSDLIGFHTYDDMRHFLSSTNRLAGIGNAHGTIEVDNRTVVADAFPMGIDYEKYSSIASEPETLAREVKYRTSLGKHKLILSIDRLDYSKGISQRLRAFELFLDKYPEFREKVSLLMLVVPSRDRIGRYKEMKEEIDELVGRINGYYSRVSWTPIHYFYRSLPINALSAFYRMAHVALVTPLRDGMNLVCKEYIASKLDKKGVLILSEMAGASKELSDALLINPNDIHEIVDALYEALTMPDKKQILHLQIMQKSLRRYNIYKWVELFMERLKFVKETQKSKTTRKLSKEVISRIEKRYSKAKKRLIFLDYDGTLTAYHSDPKKVMPDKELLSLLKKLTSDPKNNLVIISGRDKQTLSDWLGDLKLDLIGEHGVWLKEYKKDWNTLTKLESRWKKEIMPLLEVYVDRTPGSFIEEKDYSLVWHYRKVETGLGELRIPEITSHLKYLTADKDLQVLEGNRVLEIKNSVVNKGNAAKNWLDKMEADFIMAIGDDITDEDTFQTMPKDAITIRVGSSTSHARYSVKDQSDVRKLLQRLSN